MNLSPYQVEQLLLAYRDQLLKGKVTFHGEEHTQFSAVARKEAQKTAQATKANVKAPEIVTPFNILELVADVKKVDIAVDYEQQRRAGMLLDPPYIPPNPLPPIGQVKKYVNRLNQLRKEQSSVVPASSQKIESLVPKSENSSLPLTQKTLGANKLPPRGGKISSSLPKPLDSTAKPIEDVNNDRIDLNA